MNTKLRRSSAAVVRRAYENHREHRCDGGGIRVLAELLETVKAVAEGSLGFGPIPRSDRDVRIERASPRADEETRVCVHPSGSADELERAVDLALH
jgi:hypothetical protein